MGYNPAGPSSPASNTMSVFQYNTGARTRNVVNAAEPGAEGVKAYTITGDTALTSGIPTDLASNSANAGYANFRRQRYLHIQAVMGGGTVQDADEVNLFVWVYNSMSGVWTVLQTSNASNPTTTGPLKLNVKGSQNKGRQSFIIDIKGSERVYIGAEDFNDNAGSDLQIDIYLGVNSF